MPVPGFAYAEPEGNNDFPFRSAEAAGAVPAGEKTDGLGYIADGGARALVNGILMAVFSRPTQSEQESSRSGHGRARNGRTSSAAGFRNLYRADAPIATKP
jgi:hypothetical protein